MTKPLHAGRAAENGVSSAWLARDGFTAATNILEARRGFFNAMAGGYDESKISGRLGAPYFMKEPGISIKPYPSGSLSHPAQDLILDLVRQHDLTAADIEHIEVGTNSNVPNALIYPMPKTALEGKFSIPFCMAIAVIERKAGIAQFQERKVRDKKVIELMKRVTLYVDDELEQLGYDQVRSRIRIKLKNGRVIEGRYDVARGHPEKPLSWEELGDKFRDCADLVLPRQNAEEAIQLVARIEELKNLGPLFKALAVDRGKSTYKTNSGKSGRKKHGTLLASIGRFVNDLKLTEVPQAVIEKAKLVFLDTLGIALASSTMDFGPMVTRVAQKLGGPPGSLLIGTSSRVAAANAVIANSTLAHGLDYDDTLEEAIVHTGCCAGMTALAVGERSTRRQRCGCPRSRHRRHGSLVQSRTRRAGQISRPRLSSDGDLLDLRRRSGGRQALRSESRTMGGRLRPVRRPKLGNYRVSRRRHVDETPASRLVRARRRDRDHARARGFSRPGKSFRGHARIFQCLRRQERISLRKRF